jgi:alanyl-tRNA synthetase
MYLSDSIRKKYHEFWSSSPRNHKEVPNVSLVPNIDSTLLFVNSGMFPLAPYLAGQQHPLGKRLYNLQRCLRPKYEEVLEVGDNRHSIMFEMMGNWSLGDFDKTSQIPWIMELYIKHFGFDPNRIYVSVWGGDEKIPRDDLAIKTWIETYAKYGIEAEFSENIYDVPLNLEAGKNHKARIFPYPKSKNWWQRGEAVGELGGPSSEIFFDMGQPENEQAQYHINDDSGRFVEIGNNVFMEYYLDKQLAWQPLEQKNIDFGGGFERAVMCLAGVRDIFETDLFLPIIEKVSELSSLPYKQDDGKNNEHTSAFRVVADHARASVFILADGVRPSNKDQGYILRRFIRRMIRFGKKLNLEKNFTSEIAQIVIERMKEIYPHLEQNRDQIIELINAEENNFRKTLSNGLKEIEKFRNKQEPLDGKKAFYFYETYGYPIEMTIEEFSLSEEESERVLSEFKQEEEAHKALSRSGAEQKFKGGLADQSEEVIKLHTTHHLLLNALQKNVSSEIKQRGSNITGERLRIDFNYASKLTPEEIEAVEKSVNSSIEAGYEVERVEMKREEAEKIGAEMEFGQKYPDIVSIYFIKDKNGEVISKEFCGGPHVSNTREIGKGDKRFKIVSQENIGGGIRRIKAKLI